MTRCTAHRPIPDIECSWWPINHSRPAKYFTNYVRTDNFRWHSPSLIFQIRHNKTSRDESYGFCCCYMLLNSGHKFKSDKVGLSFSKRNIYEVFGFLFTVPLHSFVVPHGPHDRAGHCRKENGTHCNKNWARTEMADRTRPKRSFKVGSRCVKGDLANR